MGSLRKTRYRLMANTPLDIEEQKWSSWYVLTTSNPKHLEDLIAQADNLQEQGLSGFVYTQLSDVEEETNGLLTYDRRVNKLDQ